MIALSGCEESSLVVLRMVIGKFVSYWIRSGANSPGSLWWGETAQEEGRKLAQVL